MISEIDYKDIKYINKLGLEYDTNFLASYKLENYIVENIYILKKYEKSNNIVGFIIATKLFEVIEIHLIYVSKEYRNSGIATELIKNLKEYEGVKTILLEVSSENIPAINLYKKLGFIQNGIRKKYYNGVDAYLMEMIVE